MVLILILWRLTFPHRWNVASSEKIMRETYVLSSSYFLEVKLQKFIHFCLSSGRWTVPNAFDMPSMSNDIVEHAKWSNEGGIALGLHDV